VKTKPPASKESFVEKLKETIAKGDSGCRVVVYLKPTEESKTAKGREYYKPT
jgi:hypothetical protein